MPRDAELIEIETKIRKAIRDAVNRPTRKPFYWGGLKGYQQLAEIAPALHQLCDCYPKSQYFRTLFKRVNFALDKNRTLANNLEKTYQWLRKIAACLRYPPSQYPQIHLTPQQVAREMEALQQQFHSVQPIRRPQAILRDKLHRLWNNYGRELLHCYAIPGLPPDNLQIEGLFGRLRRHQRRISGRRSTSELREFGHYQVLFSASSQTELLDQLQRVPFSEYLIHRKKLHAAETTRRFFHRLHRDTEQTMQRLTNRYHARSLQLDETHSSNVDV